MTCIPVKQVYKQISTTISSYLRPSTPIPISPESILPQELFYTIMDELGSHIASDFENHSIEFQTLQNCALVSKSFRSLATRWVFFRASFQGRWNDETWIHKRVEGFFRILIANPSIGGSVRELFIRTSQNDSDFWLQGNALLVSILGQLSRIQRFNLVYGPLKPFNWETLPSKTATALRCTIQSPSIRFLELHDIDEFPWFILAGCRTLKDLAIFHVHASRRDFIVPAHPAPSTIAPMLESIYIISSYSMPESLVSNPITARMFSQLRILSVSFHRSWEAEAAANFIIKVAQTLETLNVISLNDRSINDEGPLDLSQLPALRHLNILRCIMGYHPMGTPQFPSSLHQFFKLRGSSNYIQTIVVHLEYEDVELGVELGIEGLFLPDHGWWADFDAILADENYRALEKVTLNLGIGFISWDPKLRSTYTERTKLLMDKLFPAVKASGRVEMDVVINMYGDDETAAQ